MNESTVVETTRSIQCNLCGCNEFREFNGRKGAKCGSCYSLERTRVCFALIQDLFPNLEGVKVALFAPETGIARTLSAAKAELEMFDFEPSGFPRLKVTAFDLCNDIHKLEDGYYDLVLHNHVLEHLPTDPISVVRELQQKVKPDGYQLFSIPILSGYYREDLNPNMDPDVRTKNFGRGGHYRYFGRLDIEDRFLKHIPGARLLTVSDICTKEDMVALNIPEKNSTVASGASIFVVTH